MSNRLKNEVSPYLLQHANNPVDWYPWSEEAFEKAKKENKPVLISIGYAACHWCHVMEKESFENQETAAYMNAHFINIKVDREEHPDVDHFYMDALQSLSGSGGWPLNMFVTPEKKPFYGGTYFPPKRMYQRLSWMEILEIIKDMWQNDMEKIDLQAEQMIKHLKQVASVETPSGDFKYKPEEVIKEVLKYADQVDGGFGLPPKFFATDTIRFCLEFHHFEMRKKSPLIELAQNALEQVILSLNAIMNGGIYDQIGGGFSRYATDREWLIPHFEKMLYDNALLITLYADAYKITGNEEYKDVVEQTIEWCRRELQGNNSDEKGFYAALDADSEGEEGKYYLWTFEEVKKLTPDVHPAVLEYYDISESGNWGGKIILNRRYLIEEVTEKHGIAINQFRKFQKEFKDRLFHERNKRIRPATDDKILLSWNALMNIAICNAGVSLGKQDYIKEAQMHLAWLLKNFKKADHGLYHVYKNGRSYIEGKLDDYSYLIRAIITFSSKTGNNEFMKDAFDLISYVKTNFAHEEQSLFYYSSKKQSDILVRKLEIYDGAVPSANSYMAMNLYDLGIYFENIEWVNQSENMFVMMQMQSSRFPSSFSCWTVFIQRWLVGLKQIHISGDKKEYFKEWNKKFFPEISSIFESRLPVQKSYSSNSYSKEYMLRLCTRFECGATVNSLDALLVQIKKTD